MDYDRLADGYKALADKTRLRILALLKEESLCVGELVSVLGMTQPAVSQHVRKLRQAGLIKERRQGQWIYYSLHGDGWPFLPALLEHLPDASADIERLKQEGKKGICE